MKNIVPGQNIALSSSFLSISLDMVTSSSFNGELDPSVFLLDESGKVLGDEGFLFYGQPKTDNGSVVVDSSGKFDIDLSKIPENIVRIALTLVIDGSSSFGDFEKLDIKVNEECSSSYPCDGRSEKALILAHIYKNKGIWKFKSVNAGFNGGLGPLATSFGVDISDDSSNNPPEPSKAPEAKSLNTEEKVKIKLEKSTPSLINLAKPISISLKKNNIENEKARVFFVLDASGSMTNQYKQGHVQSVLERIVPLAVLFDDNAELDFWAFASKSKKYENVVSENYEGYIDRNINPKFKKGSIFSFNEIFVGLGGSNNEKDVMKKVIDFCGDDKSPIYVVFVSDGGITDSSSIKKLIRSSSTLPIFWQFVGLGGSNYGILEKLDTLSDREVDNAGFFNIDDFNKISDNDLYDKLLSEYPTWLKEARKKGIVF